MSTLNLTLLTDLYELTMMQGYYKSNCKEVVVFDAFYRNNPCNGGYAICAGLEQIIDYIKNLHFSEDDIEYLRSLQIFDEDFLDHLRDFHFTGDIYAIPEGSIIFPREPLLKVIAPIMEAQLIETADRNKSCPCRLCRKWRRCDGIRTPSCTGSGFRCLRCKSRSYRRL